MPEQDNKETNDTSQGDEDSTKKETEEKEKIETSSEEKHKEEDDNESDEETREAIALYRDLKRGNKSETLQKLIKESGLDISKKDVAIDDSISSIVKKNLGENYEFLSSQLSSTLEEIVNKKIMPEIGKAQSSAVEARVENEVEKIFNEAKIPKSERDNLVGEMDSISIEMPMKTDGNLKVYLKRLYNLATGDTKISKRIAKIRDNDADSEQVASETFSDFKIRKGPNNPTLKESVKAADRKEIFDHGDL